MSIINYEDFVYSSGEESEQEENEQENNEQMEELDGYDHDAEGSVRSDHTSTEVNHLNDQHCPLTGIGNRLPPRQLLHRCNKTHLRSQNCLDLVFMSRHRSPSLTMVGRYPGPL